MVVVVVSSYSYSSISSILMKRVGLLVVDLALDRSITLSPNSLTFPFLPFILKLVMFSTLFPLNGFPSENLGVSGSSIFGNSKAVVTSLESSSVNSFFIFIIKSVIVFILSSSDILMVAGENPGDGEADVVDSVVNCAVVEVGRVVMRRNGLRVNFGLNNGLRVEKCLLPPELCGSCSLVVSFAVVKADWDVVLSVVDLLKNGLTGLSRPGNLRRRFPNKLLRPLPSFCVVASFGSSTLDNSSSSDILILSTSVVVSVSESISLKSNVVDTIIGPAVLERRRNNGLILRVTDVEGVPMVVDLARLGLRKKGGLTGLFFGLKREGLAVEMSSTVTCGVSVIISVSSMAEF